MPNKTKKVALFDICHTLIGMTTIGDFTQHFLLSPEINKKFKLSKWIQHFLFKVFRKLHIIDNEVYRKHYIRLLKGYSVEDIASLAQIYFESRLQNSLKLRILDRLKKLKQDGYEIFLVSAGFDIYLKEFSKLIGANLICTIVEKSKNNIYTGKIKGLDCFGVNKVKKIQSEIPFFDDIDWGDSVAFSDDVSDIPMLSLVGGAFVVDPSFHMEQYAIREKWEIIKTGFMSPYRKRKLFFVIRDDDLSFFSKPKDIEEYYGDIFKMGIPVSFSAIPFIGINSDAWSPLLYLDDKSKISKSEYPISSNQELTAYVKGNNLIEILQHGCTHETKSGIFEYQKHSGLLGETVRGKRELEQAFGSEIKIFVPPHDQISNHGISVIEKLKQDIIRSRGFKNIIFNRFYVVGLVKMVLHKVKYAGKSFFPAYPYIVNLGGHKEAYSNRLCLDFEKIKKCLIETKKVGGVFILVDHMHEMDGKDERRKMLYKLVKEASQSGFIFVNASELFASPLK